MDRAALAARFGCAEYFDGFAEGRYDGATFNWDILPSHEIGLLGDPLSGEALIIGRAGVDGILFCYRDGHPGIWAYYPIEGAWRRLAGSLAEFWSGWSSGRITV